MAVKTAAKPQPVYSNPDDVQFTFAGGQVSHFRSTDGINYLTFYEAYVEAPNGPSEGRDDRVNYRVVERLAIPDRVALQTAQILMAHIKKAEGRA